MKEKVTVTEEAKRHLESLGVKLPEAVPIYPAVLPKNAVDMQLKELGKWLSRFTQVLVFLEPQVALASIRDYTVEQILENCRDRTLLSPGVQSHPQASERKSLREIQKEVLDLKKKKVKANARLTLLQSVLKSYERAYNAVSREITRRALVANIEMRDV